MRTTTFNDCERDLVSRGGQAIAGAWISSDVAKDFVRNFQHRYFHTVTLSDLELQRRIVEETDPPLGTGRAADARTEIDDLRPEYPIAGLFHLFLESRQRVPTFSEFYLFAQSDAARAMCWNAFWDRAAEIGLNQSAAEKALRWRFGNAYSSSFRELWTAAWMRERAGITVNYHLFADIQMQVDLWYDNTLICIRVPSSKLQRKRDVADWARIFHIITIDIGHQGKGRLWLPTEDQLRLMSAASAAEGRITRIDSRARAFVSTPILEAASLPSREGDRPSIDNTFAKLGISIRPRYSLTTTAELTESEIVGLAREDIRVVLFSDRPPTGTDVNSLISSRVIEVHPVVSIPRDFSIVDGKGGEETLQALELVSKLALKFNFEQWLIEHAPQESHLQVQAGAGTGKTAVMIRRVDFLLHSVDGLALNDIAMITFTRDATHEMRSRLMDHLKTRHGVSGKAWYIDWLEQFPALNISTIHSLARRLLQSVCAEIGLGRSFRLNAFRQEKKRIIEDVLAAQISAQETISKVLRLPLYKFIENAVSFWEELSRKGLSLIDIEGIDWGNCTDADGARLQTIFSTLFAQAEAKLESLKLNQNSASLDDLTRQLATLASRRSLLGTGGPTFRYLFVDEFQDSDESQIRLVAALCRDFGAVLFVVGDIKQSIYRFRGATYTAFNALEKAISSFGGTLAEYTLAKNYRTASAVLDRLHPRFSSWNANGWLPYRSQDRLVPTVQDQGSFRSSGYRKKGERHQAQVLEWIREAADTLPTSGSDGRRPRAAVLVRTHREAELVHEWCSGAGIACEVRRGGDLFASEATYDLLALITAFLHPGDSVALLNLAATAYSEVHIPWPLLLRHKGDGAALRSAMENHQLTEHWAGLVETSRSEPVLSLLRSAIEHLEPSRRIRDRERERIAAEHSDWNEAEVLREANQAGIRYQLDLDRLVELMHKTFNENFASLYSVQEWLTVQRSVNREQERLDLPDEVLPAVLCTTVHASKGAEFHTVILPFTHRPFRFDRSELLLTQVANRWRAAWRLMVDEDSVITNSLYASSNQDEALEVRREETRLLYVAMTRCQRRLWICAFENSLATENWGDLLR